MKLILCTLAVCLSILGSTLTTQRLVREEGKRTRLAAKAAAEPAAAAETGDAARGFEALQAQLAALSRRLSQIEQDAAQAAANARDPGAGADLRALAANVRALSGPVARLDAVPGHLAELTTYLDRSFGHLEQTVAAAAAPEDVLVSLDWMVRKLDDIDSYFLPLYAFLGVVYDPANNDLLAEYPSIDDRLNALADALEDVRKTVAAIKRDQPVPRIIEPTRRTP